MSSELTVDATTMLAIVYSALIAALGATSLGVIRAWREVSESKAAAKQDRDALLKKHGELEVEIAAMKEQITSLRELYKRTDVGQLDELTRGTQPTNASFLNRSDAAAEERPNIGGQEKF